MVPQSESFECEGTTYVIKPNLFSDSTMSKIAAHLRSRARNQRREVIQDLKESGLPSDAMSFAMKEIVSESMKSADIGYEECAEALQSADGQALAIALADNCDEIHDQKQAREVMSKVNLLDVMSKLVEAGTSALNAAEKNSLPLNE